MRWTENYPTMAFNKILRVITGIIIVLAASCERTYHEEEAQLLMDKVKNDVATEDDYIRLIEEFTALVEKTSEEIDNIRDTKDKENAEKAMENLQTVAEMHQLLEKHPVPPEAQSRLKEAFTLSDALATKIINP